MAKRPTITTITSGYLSNSQLNSNFTNILTAFDNTVSLDGSTPNTMSNDLDMDGNQLLNLATPTTDYNAATKKYVDDNSSAGGVTAAAASAAAALASQTASESAALSAVAPSHKYLFDTSTTMANPGTGDIRYNNATVASVTNLAISSLTNSTGNPNITSFITTWDDSSSTIKGILVLRKSGSESTFAIFNITGAITNNTTWLQIPVSHVVSNGTFSNTDVVYIHFTPKGDAGTLGAIGSDVNMNGNQLQWSKGADVASATALPVLTDGNYFDVTGTTTVTSFNTTGVVGTVIKLHFDAVLTLTHHATDLILPGGANITTAAGDEAEFVEYASGDYRCTNYMKASGQPIVSSSGAMVLLSTQTASASASIDFTSLLNSTYKKYILDIIDLIPATDGVNIYMRTSTDNGSTWSGGTSYTFVDVRLVADSGSAAADASQSSSFIHLTGTNVGNASGEGLCGKIELFNPAGTSVNKLMTHSMCFFTSTGVLVTINGASSYKSLTAVNAFQIYAASGNITSGTFKLYGVS